MTNAEFNKFAETTLDEIKNLLCSKGAEYTMTDDRFENFVSGAALLQEPKEKVLLGYLTKHIISVVDIINHNTNWHKLPEKTHDIIAYMLLLEAMSYEHIKKETNHE